MPDHVKIALVGAGSVVFSMRLITDLCLSKGLYGSTISLMNRGKEKLDVVFNLAKRYANETGADFHFEKTTDRREALRDADFVNTTASASSIQQLDATTAAGERHGYYRGVDVYEFQMLPDYNVYTGYNQFKLTLDIARDMEELCPDAWLIVTANPMFELTTLISRETKTKVVGLCDGPITGIAGISGVLGLDKKDVGFRMGGVNHDIFLTNLTHHGEDAYPLLDDWVAAKAEKFWSVHMLNVFEEQTSRAAVDMYETYGRFPIGDTTRSGTWKYHHDLKTKQRWYGPTGGADSELGLTMYRVSQQDRMERMFRLANDPNARVTSEIPPIHSIEPHVDFVNAMVNDEPLRLVANVPNSGLIPGLPSDITVEVPAVVSKRGVQPEKVELPKRIIDSVLLPRIVGLEMALEGFKGGGRDVLMDIVQRSHYTRSDEQANAVVDEILSLPFNEEMKKHYR